MHVNSTAGIKEKYIFSIPSLLGSCFPVRGFLPNAMFPTSVFKLI